MTGQQFRAIRKKLGLTHKELADIMGYHRVTVAKMEQRDVVPRHAAKHVALLHDRIARHRGRGLTRLPAMSSDPISVIIALRGMRLESRTNAEYDALTKAIDALVGMPVLTPA